VGKLLVATGGRREGRAVRSLEGMVMGQEDGQGWRRLGQMPAAVAEHCTVGLGGGELLLTGGRGREDRVLKHRLRDNKWFTLHRLNEGRRRHACLKVTLNGRRGVVVSGGLGRAANSSLASVEFWEAGTGRWLQLPGLRRGRSGHAMAVARGRLVVVGGEAAGPGGSTRHLGDTEVFTGRRC
jgi:hypothetical protein